MKNFKIIVESTVSRSYSFMLERLEPPTEQEIRDTLDKDQYPQESTTVKITEVKL